MKVSLFIVSRSPGESVVLQIMKGVYVYLFRSAFMQFHLQANISCKQNLFQFHVSKNVFFIRFRIPLLNIYNFIVEYEKERDLLRE